MATLASVRIPVLKRAPKQERSKPGLRTYGDQPLPLKPSDHAPREARIVGRVAEYGNASYTVRIGEVELDNISLQEILDYVSPFELEEFENQQFVEEGELLRIAEEEMEREHEARLARRNLATKRTGSLSSQTDTDEDEDSDVSAMAAGRHGRARPTYAHLFQLPEQRRRRRRDPNTGELMPLDDMEQIRKSELTAQPAEGSPDRLKRRRRKRDRITGELLPLSPIIHKEPGVKSGLTRQRRRRHPTTGELMPLGWRHDSNVESETSDGGRLANDGVPSALGFGDLNINTERALKRQKLVPSLSSEKYPLQGPSSGRNTNQDRSESEPDSEPQPSKPRDQTLQQHGLQSFTKTPKAYKEIATQGMLRAYKSDSSSSDSVTVASFLDSKLAPRPSSYSGASAPPKVRRAGADHIATTERPKTSILQPSMISAEGSDDDQSSGEDLEEDSWVVESIMGHQLSDPKTHPTELGKKSVMLYLVKWEGFDDLTWEPRSSFEDQTIVEAYHKAVDQGRAEKARRTVAKSIERHGTADRSPQKMTETSRAQTVSNKSATASEESDGEEDEGWEIEAILAHRMSDPRTHPGRKQAMLYQVKWHGYPEPTWEPLASFIDKGPVEEYRRRVGSK